MLYMKCHCPSAALDYTAGNGSELELESPSTRPRLGSSKKKSQRLKGEGQVLPAHTELCRKFGNFFEGIVKTCCQPPQQTNKPPHGATVARPHALPACAQLGQGSRDFQSARRLLVNSVALVGECRSPAAPTPRLAFFRPVEPHRCRHSGQCIKLEDTMFGLIAPQYRMISIRVPCVS